MYGEWRRDGKSHLTHDEHGNAFSYETIILQTLEDGTTIGNVTQYSNTTSHHQSKVGVRGANILVDGVPAGKRRAPVTDLRKYAQDPKHVVTR